MWPQAAAISASVTGGPFRRNGWAISIGTPGPSPSEYAFNDTFDKRFFRTERFRDVRHLAGQLARFERFHNTHHRYAAIGRATSAEFAAQAGFEPRLLERGFQLPERLPRRGRVEFIRLVRSDRILSVLGEQIALGADQVHEYVTAILHVHRGELEVVHGGRTVKRVDFAVRG